MLRVLTDIDTVVIHCSDTQNGDDRWRAVDIDEWHRKREFNRDPVALKSHGPDAFKHIGYHRVIHLAGDQAWGRMLTEVGAHVAGHNRRSIGVCMIGRDAFSLRQWESLRSFVRAMQSQLVIPQVVGHCDLDAAKTCPGFNVQEWLDGGMEPLKAHLLSEDKITWKT